jgi:hypothetical protein
MKISSDYKDLLRNLNAAGVRYLIVGGYAGSAGSSLISMASLLRSYPAKI